MTSMVFCETEISKGGSGGVEAYERRSDKVICTGVETEEAGASINYEQEESMTKLEGRHKNEV